jgi:hypothetical protein
MYSGRAHIPVLLLGDTATDIQEEQNGDRAVGAFVADKPNMRCMEVSTASLVDRAGTFDALPFKNALAWLARQLDLESVRQEMLALRSEVRAIIEEKDAIIEAKDAIIEEKDATIEEKDATIEEKDTIIEELRANQRVDDIDAPHQIPDEDD